MVDKTRVTKMFESCETLVDICSSLNAISNAFSVTGNDKVSRNLRNIAAAIYREAENQRNLVHEWVDHESSVAKHHSKNLLEVATIALTPTVKD